MRVVSFIVFVVLFLTLILNNEILGCCLSPNYMFRLPFIDGLSAFSQLLTLIKNQKVKYCRRIGMLCYLHYF
jgi:hypothetical protein